MKKVIFASLSLLLFASCYYGQPLSSQPPRNNATYQVEYLFEHDGCKVYRFHDLGNWVYFTNCRGESISVTDSTQIRNRTERKN